MTDTTTQTTLREIVRRESRSMLSYMADAYPWTNVAGNPGLDALKQLIREEAASVNAMGKHLLRHHGMTPLLGAYPTGFTSHNFIALSYLLPKLADEERLLIRQLEKDLPAIEDATGRELAQHLLTLKRRNLATLEGLTRPRTG